MAQKPSTKVVLVAFAHNNNHLDIDDYKSNKLPNFARAHSPSKFSRNHRRIKLIVFSEIKLFRFYCHYFLLLRYFKSQRGYFSLVSNRCLFRNNFPERFEFSFINKQVMQDMFDPVTRQSDLPEGIIGITAGTRIFFIVRYNRINRHCCGLAV